MNEKREILERIVEQIDAITHNLDSLDRLCADRQSQAEVVTLVRQSLGVASASAQALILNINMSEG